MEFKLSIEMMKCFGGNEKAGSKKASSCVAARL